MVTTSYSDQQGSKSRQKIRRLYKQWHRPMSKRFIKPLTPYRDQPRSTRNVVAYPRPAFSAKKRENYAPTSRAVWGMLYADDTCIIVSRSPHGLAKMMEVIVEVCRAFGLNRAGEEDRDHAYAPLTAYTADDGASRRNRANIQTSAILHLPRGRRDRPDMSVEIARRTRACWMGIRLYLRELYDQPKVALSLKTRMVKPEVIEAPV